MYEGGKNRINRKKGIGASLCPDFLNNTVLICASSLNSAALRKVTPWINPFIIVDCGVAIITLNRSERWNAINQELLIHLNDCLDEVSRDGKIGVAIITGKGKSFCSGLTFSGSRPTTFLIPGAM